MPAHATATNVVVGPILLDPEFKRVYPDLVIIQNHETYVFKCIAFASSALQYRLHVASTDQIIHWRALNDAGEARKMLVVETEWRARKPSLAVMRAIFLEEEMSWSDASRAAFEAGGAEALLVGHPESDGLRLIVLGARISRLCSGSPGDPAHYDLKTVLAMPDAHILRVNDMLDEMPFTLCFHRAHGLEIPDIRNPPSLDGWQREAHRFYQRMKEETYEGCHSVSPCEGVSREALDWLLAMDILVRSPVDPSFVYLGEIYEQESALLEAIARIEANSEVARLDEEPRLSSGGALCDEQDAALRIMLRCPVLAINGEAGSGKSDMLNVAKQVFGSHRIYATAFQGVNAGQLKHVAVKTSTTHKMLYDHSRNHGNFGCVFSEIDALVIDEAGTLGLRLFAGAVAALAACGSSKKRLIVVGDLGQLPPIGGPSPFRFLMDYFAGCGYLARFHHNHRIDAESRLLLDNAKAILKNSPDRVRWDHESFVMCPTSPSESVENALVNAIRRFDLKEDDFVVVTHQNKHRRRLCSVIEEHYGGGAQAGAQIGHKFCFTKNNYDGDVPVVNNEILILRGIEDFPPPEKRGDKHVRFAAVGPRRKFSTTESKAPDDTRFLIVERLDGTKRRIKYDGAIVGQIRKASAVTTNAMQGSAARIIIRVDYCDSRYSSRERLYTDVTRAKEIFIYIGKIAWFLAAIGRPEPIPRSHLAERAMAMRAIPVPGKRKGRAAIPVTF